MKTKATERLELRISAAEKNRLLRASRRRGISMSDWARRRLAEAVAEELASEEPPEPSDDDVAEALAARGSMQGERARQLRARIDAAREEPWTR